jgi:hypothetical protein
VGQRGLGLAKHSPRPLYRRSWARRSWRCWRGSSRSDPVPPSRLRDGAPHDLEVICLKCLEKDLASATLLDRLREKYGRERVTTVLSADEGGDGDEAGPDLLELAMPGILKR